MNKRNKRIQKTLTIVVAALILLLTGYVVYVKTSVTRIEDNLTLQVEKGAEVGIGEDTSFSILTYNVGMGIYSRDFGFFMDGGKEGRAFSKEEVVKNTDGAISVMEELSPDFLFVEETGKDCTCAYHVDQLAALTKAFGEYDIVYAQDWDSPYFMYPIFKPFGKAVAGLTVLSKYGIESSTRISLPLEDSFTNFVDLDRCYVKSVIPTENGHDLVLYCIHASAYTSTAETANRQIELLMADMTDEYEKGNYVLAGGDWNRTVDGDPEKLYGVSTEGYSWVTPIDASVIPDSFTLVSGLDEAQPVPSCRNADGP